MKRRGFSISRAGQVLAGSTVLGRVEKTATGWQPFTASGSTLGGVSRTATLAGSRLMKAAAPAGARSKPAPAKKAEATGAEGVIQLCAERYIAEGRSRKQAYAMCSRMAKDKRLTATGEYIPKKKRAR